MLIEEFAKEYKSDSNCIPLNTNKYMSFSVPIKKEVIEPSDGDDKKGKKNVLTYSLRFTDSAKHMARGLSTLVDNLSELTIGKCAPNDTKDLIAKAKNVRNKDYIPIKCNTCNLKRKLLPII